jgi:putative transposase
VAVGDIVPVPGVPFEETLASASPDLLREMIRGFAQRMMDAEVEQLCGAGYGEVSPDRVNSRNGYRRREWDTRAGTIELAVPKLRQGSYYPEWLLERRRWAERALATVVATSYLLGSQHPPGGEARRVAGRDEAVEVAGQRHGGGAG